jgi:thiamine biosynthesis protein ThiI
VADDEARLHRHLRPLSQLSDPVARSIEKARSLATLLTRWQHRSRLYLVPFGENQQQVLLTVPAPMRVVVYRA